MGNTQTSEKKGGFYKTATIFIVGAALGIYIYGNITGNTPNNQNSGSFQYEATASAQKALERNIPEEMSLNDSDKDGLVDVLETIFSTDPNNSDTDGDGYLDGNEIIHGYNPTKKAPGDKVLDIPSKSEITMAPESNIQTIIKYFEDSKTPPPLQDASIYQRAIANATNGDTKELGDIIQSLEKSYSDLKAISVPEETLEIHRYTLALMPALIDIFRDIKKARSEPNIFLTTLEKLQAVSPFVTLVQVQINAVAQKYDISTE